MKVLSMKRIISSNISKWVISIIVTATAIFMILTGCSSEDVSGSIKFYDEPTAEFTAPDDMSESPLSSEQASGSIKFYNAPTVEFTAPAGMNESPLSSKQASELKKILANVDTWSNDYNTDRVLFYFDGEFEFSDSDTVYYFSYEHSVIYYDHYYGRITEEGMGYIKQITRAAQGKSS